VLTTFIRKELLEHLMSLRFAIACMLSFVVIVTGFFVRCEEYVQTRDNYHEAQAMAKHRLRELERPYDLVWDGWVYDGCTVTNEAENRQWRASLPAREFRIVLDGEVKDSDFTDALSPMETEQDGRQSGEQESIHHRSPPWLRAWRQRPSP